ncbi:TonB-dependent receptor [Erythrobacter litoralis]|uniref:TonB-dependent receptor n=1 Tax=Erythrobacter litoralis TaxID=39960 RepID=UPI0024360DDB|nr:TonB-dependent receptor [Erythrobacter litoralis]
MLEATVAEEEQAGGVDVIVVTAQRREQDLQDVPVAVTALTGEAIQANRIQDVTDLSSIAPNLSVRVGAGGSKLPQYTLRGIYTFGSAIGADKGVSLYVDGVYIQTAAGSVLEFADIERIEVLRGPQGTLFGRNATGGAISITTREPTGELGFRQEVTYGNYDQLRSKTRVDLPRIGPIAVTASYLHSERRGDTDNLGAGTQFDFGPATGGRKGVLTSPETLGNENNEGVFVAADVDFHPDLTVSYKYDYAEADYVPGATGLAYLADPSVLQFGGTPPTLAPFGFYSSATNPMTPISLTRPDAVNNWLTLGGENKSEGHNFTVEWAANDVLTFKNILAHRTAELENNYFQLDGLGGLNLPATLGGFPFTFVVNNSYNKDSQWSNEFQVNVATEWFNITGGLLYFNNDQEAGGSDDLFNVLQGSPIIGQNTDAFLSPFTIPQNTGYQSSFVEVTSKALYAQAEFYLTDTVSAVGGLRFTKDRKIGQESVPGSIPNPSQGRTVPIDYRDDRVTYLLGVNYQPTPEILAYAKYATGFISGGQLATITFAPETAKSWEAGLKADLFDRALRTNLAVFHVDYGSIQAATLGVLTGVASAAQFGQAIVPYADSVAKGFELETTFVPVPALTLSANVGYTDFKFKEDTIFAPLRIGAGVPGVQEFFRPKWVGNVSAQYDVYDVAGGDLMFRADLGYKSRTLLSNDTTPGSGLTSQEDPAYRAAVTGQEQFLLNGRVALKDLPIGAFRGEVALWGKNLLDDDSIVQATGLGFASAVQYQQARTYGIDLSIEF